MIKSKGMHKEFYKQIGRPTHYKSLLCLNGELPTREFFLKEPIATLPIIAVDGALNTLDAIGITPHLVIGDLDSARLELLTAVKSVFLPDQSKGDFQKAMEYLGQHDLIPTIILGISGGCFDHILNNMYTLLAHKSTFYSPPIFGYVLRDELLRLSLPIYSKISLISLPKAKVTTQGLKWELKNKLLEFPYINSCSNRTNQSEVMIKVDSGCVCIMVYTHHVEDAGLW